MSQGWDSQFDEVARLHREHMALIDAARDAGPPRVKAAAPTAAVKGKRHQRRAAIKRGRVLERGEG